MGAKNADIFNVTIAVEYLFQRGTNKGGKPARARLRKRRSPKTRFARARR